MILLGAQVDLVGALDSVGTPDALECERLPSRSAAVGNRAGPALKRRRQGGGCAILTFQISAVVVQAGCRCPVEHPFGVALDREAVHGVGQ